MGDGEQPRGAGHPSTTCHPGPVYLLQGPQLQLDVPLVEASIVRMTIRGLLAMVG